MFKFRSILLSVVTVVAIAWADGVFAQYRVQTSNSGTYSASGNLYTPGVTRTLTDSNGRTVVSVTEDTGPTKVTTQGKAYAALAVAVPVVDAIDKTEWSQETKTTAKVGALVGIGAIVWGIFNAFGNSQ
jgi:hypothetical protein